MEERVGLWWHQLVSRVANKHHPQAAVTLASQGKALGILFRALGGAHGVNLDAGSNRENNARRSLLERIAGTGSRVEHAWLDDQALRLPALLDVYPEGELNSALYQWLAALGAVSASHQQTSASTSKNNWIANNQRATRYLLNNCAGLATTYERLVSAEFQRRGALETFSKEDRLVETVIRQALVQPGSVSELPQSAGKFSAPQPVLLWLSPALRQGREAADSGDSNDSASAPTVQQDNKRRQAKDAGGPARKGGMLIFRPESIFSWTEYARVEHEVQENEDEDLGLAADDLDILSVAKDNTAVAKKLRMKLDRGERVSLDMALPENCLRVPEWDYRQGVLHADHCAINQLQLPYVIACDLPQRLVAEQRQLHRQLSALIPERQIKRNQQDGSDIDLDACIRQRCTPMHPRQDLYRDARKQQRDLACLLLADLSLSTDAALDGELRIIDVLRDSLLLFSESLAVTRDRFSVLGFSSRQRHDVRITELKGFNERYSGQVRQRILDVKPGNYTRMGAAIRFATLQLNDEQCREKLLLLLSDGKPNDADYYEGRYGIEDTREALAAARKNGLRPFCITIDHEAEDYLPHIFGKNGFAIVTRPKELPRRLTQLYALLTRGGGR